MLFTAQTVRAAPKTLPLEKLSGCVMNESNFLLSEIAIAKAKEELVLKLIADEAERLEGLKAEARAAAKARGLADEAIESLLPPYPAGAFGLNR